MNHFQKSFFFLFLAVLVGAAPCAHAQPQDMHNHLWYSVYGSSGGMEYAGTGLNYIGKISDSIPNAVTIGQAYGILSGHPDVFSGLAFNRTQYDTTIHAMFNGTHVLPANINGDSLKDYVVWDDEAHLSVLLGTPKVDSFIPAFSYYFGSANNNAVSVIPYDYDSSGHDGLIVSLPYQNKIEFFHGGVNMDTIPDTIIDAFAMHMSIGNVRDTSTMYLAIYSSGLYSDTAKIILYQFQKGKFPIDYIDTLIFNTKAGGNTIGVNSDGGFALIDVWGRKIEDFLLAAGSTVLVYKGGENINGQQPDYRFDDPFPGGASEYGDKIFNVGNFTGWGYPSILITDYDGSYGGEQENGGVFLFNIGAGLSDTCKGYAYDPISYQGYFGETAICAGDVLNNGRTAIMVGSQVDDLNNADVLQAGELSVFLGDPSYGYPVTGVTEPPASPQYFSLSQNYPNPFTSTSQITFTVVEPQLYGKEIALTVSDILGRNIATLYRGVADAAAHTVTIDGAALPAGNYFYELQCNGWHLRREMTSVK